MGVSITGGTRNWFVDREKIPRKMDDFGPLIFGKPPYHTPSSTSCAGQQMSSFKFQGTSCRSYPFPQARLALALVRWALVACNGQLDFKQKSMAK